MNKLERLLQLPWTILVTEHEDDGHYFVARVEELPGFLVAERSAEELDVEFWDALRSHVGSYLERGEEPPLPAGLKAIPPAPAMSFEIRQVGTESAGSLDRELMTGPFSTRLVDRDQTTLEGVA